MPSRPTPLKDVVDTCHVDGFSCGEPSLDDWLKKRARDSEGKTARTYAVTAGDRVIAYYCVATGSVERDRLPRKLRHGNPDLVPVLVLGRLAVDQDFQKRGLGQDLMAHCFRQCAAAAGIVGARALVVNPLNDRAARFYRDLGFQDLPGEPRVMFLAIETIKAAVAAEPA